jgi:4-hydroxyphenylpyruvate dioxygenase-like putative hemolysin
MKEEVEQLDELKVPKVPFLQKHLLGANLRDVAGRVHDMGHHELKSLHQHYEKHPAQSVVQAQQHRSIKKALRKFGDPQGTHNPVDKKKFVKKDLEESKHATLNTIKHLLSGD